MWKHDADGKRLKAKARWVLRGLQSQQQNDVVVESPAATRPGLQLTLQLTATRDLDVNTFDLNRFPAGRCLHSR